MSLPLKSAVCWTKLTSNSGMLPCLLAGDLLTKEFQMVSSPGGPNHYRALVAQVPPPGVIPAPTKARQDGKPSSILFLLDIIAEHLYLVVRLSRSFPVPDDGGDFGPGWSGSRTSSSLQSSAVCFPASYGVQDRVVFRLPWREARY
jgi:hypothetical protein